MRRDLTARSIFFIRTLGILGASLVVFWSLSEDNGFAQGGSSQTMGAGAEGMTAAMGEPPRALDRAPYAALPPHGGSATDSSDEYAIAGLGLIALAHVDIDGAAGAGSSAKASAEVSTSSVVLFGGRVRADAIRAHAMADSTDNQTHISGDVNIEGLMVDNMPITPVQVGQSIPLPGIGRVIAREVVLDPGGSSVTAHGLRVVGDAAPGPLRGSQLIVARAVAGIPSVSLSPPEVAAVPLDSVLRPGATLSTFEPIAPSVHANAPQDETTDNFSLSDGKSSFNDNSSSDHNDNGSNNDKSSNNDNGSDSDNGLKNENS